MRSLLLAIVLLIIWIFLCGMFIVPRCCQPTEVVATVPPKIQPVLNNSIDVRDNSSLIASFSEGILFDNNDDKPIISLKDSSVITKLSAYLNNNPNKRLVIEGKNKNDEQNTSGLASLGMARALSIKDLLVKKGTSSDQIDIQPIVDNDMKLERGRYSDAISFGLGEVASNNDNLDIANLEAEKPKIYFAKNANSLIITPELRTYFEKVKKYCDKYSSSKVQLTGHTDASGDRNYNIELGRKRANFIKNYLIRQGVPSNNIVVSSKGPDELISNQNTPQADALNRRVEMSVSK